MTNRNEVYKCEKCGNLIGIIIGAGGGLVCCGQNMVLLKGNTTDAAREKHIPVITKNGSEVTATVGAAPHPMEEKHYIQVIGILTDDKLYRAYLKPGDKPEASFTIEGEIRCARAYCNLHGMWITS